MHFCNYNINTNMFAVRMILITTISAAPIAAYANCTDPTYKKNHAFECSINSNTVTGTAIALGGLAAAGAVIAISGSGGGGSSDSGTSSMPTMNTYNYVGADVSASHLASVKIDDEYAKNQFQYDSIRLAYSLARGYTGKDTTIAVLDSESWHGETVSAIATGHIAPDAIVQKYNIADKADQFISYHEIGDIVIRASKDADIINASWNTEMRTTDVHSRAQMAALTSNNFINGLISATSNNTIFVWAAGNEGSDQPGALSALPRLVPELQGHFINVVAWDDNTGTLADYSNACGNTMQYCITAPGTDITANDRIVSGTSFATPIVSAAIAVIREKFPYMTAPQITNLLFETARDIGANGVDAVYGHGMLDLERATRPVGAELVPLDNGTTTPLRTARVSGAIGRKIKNAGIKMAFIDDYGRAFETNLSDHIEIKNYGRGYEHLRPEKTSANAGPIEFGFRRSDFLAAEGLLGTDERNIITFIAMNGEFYAGNNKILLRPEIGAARPRGRTDSMITKFSGIYTASVTAQIQHDDIGFAITIPDIILSGDMDMRVPVGRNAHGNLLFQDASTSLAGSAAVEYSVSYKFITAAFVDNPTGTDEIFILAKRKMAF